jgi:hypothetical protein
MALTSSLAGKNVGMILLGLWLILTGILNLPGIGVYLKILQWDMSNCHPFRCELAEGKLFHRNTAIMVCSGQEFIMGTGIPDKF